MEFLIRPQPGVNHQAGIHFGTLLRHFHVCFSLNATHGYCSPSLFLGAEQHCWVLRHGEYPADPDFIPLPLHLCLLQIHPHEVLRFHPSPDPRLAQERLLVGRSGSFVLSAPRLSAFRMCMAGGQD